MSPHPEQSRWFTDEVLPHEPDLRAWLRARFPSLGDIDDVVQEAYTRLLKAHATGPIASVRGFIFVTARNFALNHLRHQRVEQPDQGADIDVRNVQDPASPTAETLAKQEDLQLLIRAIQSLPDRCREVMMLRKIYGLSQKEVATQLGISEHTVEAQAAIGLRRCIEYFQRHGYGRLQRP